MNQQNLLRKLLNRQGWDICRYRPFLESLSFYNVDLVIDVGAIEGQFITELRHCGYGGSTISFEPCSEPFKSLASLCEKDPRHTAINKALGEKPEKKAIRVYSDTRFSSFHKLTGVDLDFVEETISVSTLDEEFAANADFYSQFARKFLKIDTQGFEKQVLNGATDSLADVCGVMMECSLTPIYEGQWNIEQAFSFLRNRGFTPWIMKRGFYKGLREYEVDCIFYRE